MTRLLNRKPTKVGNSFYFRIDKGLINNEEIKITETYDLDVKNSK